MNEEFWILRFFFWYISTTRYVILLRFFYSYRETNHGYQWEIAKSRERARELSYETSRAAPKKKDKGICKMKLLICFSS